MHMNLDMGMGKTPLPPGERHQSFLANGCLSPKMMVFHKFVSG